MAHDAAAVSAGLTSVGAARVDYDTVTGALDRTLIHGVSWIGGLKGATLLLSWASTVLVARILSPEDYGLVTMATIFLGLTTMVTDFGLGGAIVALRELSSDTVAQLHTVSMLVGVAAFGAGCLAAVPLSRFFNAPGLAAVVVALSAALVVDSLRTVPTAVLTRTLRFKYIALLETSKVLIAVVLTLSLAVAGAKHWALVLGNVFSSLVITAVVLTIWPQRLAWPRFRSLKSTLTFSSNFLVGNLAWYGYTNSDFLVAGRILGKVALGEYTLAWTLTSTPGEKVMSVIGRVMPTLFARVQCDPPALRRYFFLFTEVLALLILPSAIGLALVAPDFVVLVFGAKWSAAILPLQVLCCYVPIHLLGTPLSPVLQVKGQASYPMFIGLTLLAVLPPAFYFAGSRWGTAGIAAAWLAIYPAVLLRLYRRAFRALEISVRDYLIVLAPTLFSTAAMAAVVVMIQIAAGSGTPLALRFALQVAAGAATFTGTAMLLHRRRFGALADFLRTIRS